jgi:hypothetical protein
MGWSLARARAVTEAAQTASLPWATPMKAGPPCQICVHPEKARIELMRASGVSLDVIAAKFNVQRDAVNRHWHKHVSDEAKASYLCGMVDFEHLAQKAAEEGDSVLDYLKICRTSLLTQLAVMNEAGDAKGVIGVTAQLTRTLEAIAKVTGELSTLANNTININTTNNVAVLSEHPMFVRLQAAILNALAAHPEARRDVIAALNALDDGPLQAPALPAPKVIDHEEDR